MLGNSDLVKAGSTVDVSADNPRGNLPDGFQGLIEHPILVSTRTSLAPVTSQVRALYLGQTGIPAAYEVRGAYLDLFPAPNDDYSLWCECWIFPDELEPSDDLPFDGLLDRVIADVTLQVIVGGLPMLSNAQLQVDIAHRLETALITRRPSLPERRPIHYF